MNFRLLLLLIGSIGLVMFSGAYGGERTLYFQDTASTNSNNKHHSRGWVPKELLPKDAVERLVPEICRGTYLPFANRDTDIKPGFLYITGDEARITEKEKSEFFGSIRIYFTGYQLFADKASIDRATGIVEAEGRVRFFHDNLLFFGSSFWLNSKTGEMKMDGVDFVNTDTRQNLKITFLHRDAGGAYKLEQSYYSTCEPGENTWKVYGSNITLDYQQGWGTVTNAVIYVKDIPIFYFPWFQFPLDKRRHTGLLLPDISISGDDGLFYRQPIYFNLAPNFDATLFPTYYSKRGLLAEAEARFLSEHTMNAVTASGINDRLTGSWRSRKNLQHTGGINLPFRTRIDYTEVSDLLYFDDLHKFITSSNSKFINQTMDISANYQHFSFRAGQYDIQPVGVSDEQSTGYAKLPEGEISYQNRFGPLLVELTSIYSHFVPKRLTPFTTTEIDDGDKVSAVRQHNQAKLGLAFEQAFGFARSQLIFYNTRYEQENQKVGNSSNLSRSTRTAVLDVGLFFDRLVDINQTSYQQTLEPRLFLVQSDYVDQNKYPIFSTIKPRFTYDSLFRANRFQGYDRIGDARSISYSLTSRLQDRQGYEFFKIGVGQIYYDRPERVTLNAQDPTASNLDKHQSKVSPIAARMQITLGNHMRLNNDYTFNQSKNRSELNRWNFQHRWDTRTVYNLGYNLLYDELEEKEESRQAYASGVVQVSSHWALLGRYAYDLKQDYTSEALLGFENDSCCWRMRSGILIKNAEKNDPDSEYGIFFQFYFKSLSGIDAGVGHSYDSNLDEQLGKTIPGFRNRQLYLPD